jgi:hypothetical protein
MRSMSFAPEQPAKAARSVRRLRASRGGEPGHLAPGGFAGASAAQFGGAGQTGPPYRAAELCQRRRRQHGAPVDGQVVQGARRRSAARSVQGKLFAGPCWRSGSLRLGAHPCVAGAGEGRPCTRVFYGGLFLFAPASLARHAGQVNAWLVEALQRPDIAERYRQAAIEPTPLSLDQVRSIAADRLRTIDAMRLAIFGRTR